MRKAKYALVVALFVLVIVVAGNWLYSNRPRPVKITFVAPVEQLSVSIYRGADLDAHNIPLDSSDQSLITLQDSQIIELKPGAYILVSDDSDIYAEFRKGFIVDDDTAEILVDPLLTEASYEKILNQQKEQIASSLAEKYPALRTKNWSIHDLRLYQQGQWCGATLTGAETDDFFHVILKKDGGDWTVMTEPSILLSHVVYPEIPRAILVSENKKQFEPLNIRN